MSAAVLHDLPIFTDALERVTLTRDRPGGGARRRYVRVYGGQLPAADITDTGGVRVTTAARTVVDLACTVPAFRSVPIGDAALRAGLAEAELAESWPSAGSGTASAPPGEPSRCWDPRSESVGESASRVVFRDHGIPDPQPQFVIVDGSFSARADFAWPELRTLGEFDGKLKYGDLVPGGRRPADILWEEKIREDRLRALGWQVVRWTWTNSVASDRPGPPAARRLRARLSALTATSAWSPYVCMGMGCLHGQ